MTVVCNTCVLVDEMCNDMPCTGTRLSLDTIKRRLQAIRYTLGDESKEDPKPPLFKVDVVLAIPNVVMRPNLEDLQHSLNKGVQIILKASQVCLDGDMKIIMMVIIIVMMEVIMMVVVVIFMVMWERDPTRKTCSTVSTKKSRSSLWPHSSFSRLMCWWLWWW